MSAIIVTGAPNTATKDQLGDFFSFCGKIKFIDLSPGKATVVFESKDAAPTAVLLSGSELNHSKLTIVENPDAAKSSGSHVPSDEQLTVVPDTTNSATGAASSKPAGSAGTASSGTAAGTGASGATGSGGAAASGASTNTSTTLQDIQQEDKPKSQIVAEMLANGYVLGDKVSQQAGEFDKKYGISDKYSQFVKQLEDNYKTWDQKYHITDKTEDLKAKAADKATDADKATGLSDWLKGASDSVQKYFTTSPTGVQISQFYTDLSNKLSQNYSDWSDHAQAIQVEAKRLAGLKVASEGGDPSKFAPPSAFNSTDVDQAVLNVRRDPKSEFNSTDVTESITNVRPDPKSEFNTTKVTDAAYTESASGGVDGVPKK